MPTIEHRHVLLLVSNSPIKDEVLRELRNHQKVHCVALEVAVEGPTGGGFTASPIEFNSRADGGYKIGPPGGGSSEGSAIADLLVHALEKPR